MHQLKRKNKWNSEKKRDTDSPVYTEAVHCRCHCSTCSYIVIPDAVVTTAAATSTLATVVKAIC